MKVSAYSILNCSLVTLTLGRLLFNYQHSSKDTERQAVWLLERAWWTLPQLDLHVAPAS